MAHRVTGTVEQNELNSWDISLVVEDEEEPEPEEEPGPVATGWVSHWFYSYIKWQIPFSSFDQMVWQNMVPDEHGVLQPVGGEWNQFEEFPQYCNAAGVKPLFCIYGDLKPIIEDESKLATMCNSVRQAVVNAGYRGVVIDWEGAYDDGLYTTLIDELVKVAGEIWPVGLWPRVNVSELDQYNVNGIFLMTYDYWSVPSSGTVEDVVSTVKMWEEAGWERHKLHTAIPCHCTSGMGTTGWAAYNQLAPAHQPGYYDNSFMHDGTQFYFNSRFEAAVKSALVKGLGLGGEWFYEIGTDTLISDEELSIIDEALRVL